MRHDMLIFISHTCYKCMHYYDSMQKRRYMHYYDRSVCRSEEGYKYMHYYDRCRREEGYKYMHYYDRSVCRREEGYKYMHYYDRSVCRREEVGFQFECIVFVTKVTP